MYASEAQNHQSIRTHTTSTHIQAVICLHYMTVMLVYTSLGSCYCVTSLYIFTLSSQILPCMCLIRAVECVMYSMLLYIWWQQCQRFPIDQRLMLIVLMCNA